MTETKYISFSELREDMEIKGYKKGSKTTFASQKIVSIKKNKVFFNWGEPLENASDYVFSIELTEEELFIGQNSSFSKTHNFEENSFLILCAL